jgi:hypothetical protein
MFVVLIVLYMVLKIGFSCLVLEVCHLIKVASFSPSAHDLALSIHLSSHGCTFLLLYIDDMLITLKIILGRLCLLKCITHIFLKLLPKIPPPFHAIITSSSNKLHASMNNHF